MNEKQSLLRAGRYELTLGLVISMLFWWNVYGSLIGIMLIIAGIYHRMKSHDM